MLRVHSWVRLLLIGCMVTVFTMRDSASARLFLALWACYMFMLLARLILGAWCAVLRMSLDKRLRDLEDKP